MLQILDYYREKSEAVN